MKVRIYKKGHSYYATKNRNWDGEICTKCKRDQRIAWSIKDDKWNAVISKSNFNRNRVFCFECFLALADEKGIDN